MTRLELIRSIAEEAPLDPAARAEIEALLQGDDVRGAEHCLDQALGKLPERDAQKHCRRLADTITG
jgi:hypothetical protein